MSWTVDVAGTPENVKAALARHEERLQEQKHPGAGDFAARREMLEAVVDLSSAADETKFLRLVASGHSSVRDGKVEHAYLSINIEPSQTATV